MDLWIKKNLSKRTLAAALLALTLLSIGLHLWRISYPAKPVFDEAHFSTYAAAYPKNTAYFDIHPPLGKMIYGATLVASGNPMAGAAEFVSFTVSRTAAGEFKVDMSNWDADYAGFPYVLLRIISSLFGALLPLAFFSFLKSLRLADIPALAGAAFLVFDNALLLETKLILMNGMYLALGFLALAMYFEGRKHIAFAGVFLGLALAVKLIAVSFFGVILADLIFSGFGKERLSRAGKLLAFAFAALLVVYIFNFAIFPLEDNVNLARKLLGAKDKISISDFSVPKKAAYAALAFFQDVDAGASGYIYGAKDHPLQSSWFEWPVARRAMLYFDAGGARGNLVLVGNYFLWISGFLAAVYAAYRLLRALIKKRETGAFLEQNMRVPFLLFAGYLASLAPYFFAVRRSTFLYHYFPALIFSAGLLCWLLEEKIKRPWQLAAVLALAILSFALEAGCVYGFSCLVL